MVKFNQTNEIHKDVNKIRINAGFTLVELLVVIVILGILTSLSVFSWNSWQRRTAESEVKSDLTMLVSAMKNELNFNNAYPSGLPTSYKAGSGVTVTYRSGSASTYCIDAVSKKKTNITMFINEDGRVKKGTCASGEIADYYPEGSLVVSALSAGLNSSCAISQGKVYCWGNNGQGQLGNASNTNSNKPVAVNTSGVLNGKTITQISTGYAHSCALADGLAYCWGLNDKASSATTRRPTATYRSRSTLAAC